MKIEELCEILTKYQVPLEKWREGEAYAIEELLDEINSGEAKLEPRAGKLFRHIEPVFIDVYYRNGETLRHLEQESQLLPNGIIRSRKGKSSVSEKRSAGEDPVAACRRAICEELGIETEADSFIQIGADEEIKESKIFPGLKTHLRAIVFQIYLNKYQFRPEGYIERGARPTRFVWREILQEAQA